MKYELIEKVCQIKNEIDSLNEKLHYVEKFNNCSTICFDQGNYIQIDEKTFNSLKNTVIDDIKNRINYLNYQLELF